MGGRYSSGDRLWASGHGTTRSSPLECFVGSAQVARELSQSLKPMGWRYWQPSLDDATSQTAKLTKRIEGQGIKQIDFLGSIVGLKTEGITQRAIVLNLADGTHVRVLHPLDVLESRLKNLAELPSKRNPQGIAQAHLAIDVVRCFLEHLLREESSRRLLNAIERVARMAQEKSLEVVFHDYGLDLLTAVPADRVPSDAGHRSWHSSPSSAAPTRSVDSGGMKPDPDNADVAALPAKLATSK